MSKTLPSANALRVQQQADSRRRLHFASGGTVATWRGRAATFTDRRKAQSKRACRGRVSQEQS
jgi:hypothetical protein